MNTRRSFAGAALIAGGVAAAYVRWIRPWTKRWGATDEETRRELPGDSVVAKADYVATRAITINAAPQSVWPWLVQIGSDRAGWYSYDRIDNGGRPSAETILPEFQHLAVDDLVPMIPGKDVGVWVKEIEPGRRMLWWDRKGEYSWEWVVEPVVDGTSRLVSRLRATYPPLLSPRMLYVAVATSGDILMTRRCLLGIKRRAETLGAADAQSPVAGRAGATKG